MKPLWAIGLGGFFCAGVIVLSRMWLPYGDTGVTDSAIYHLTATGALIASIGFAFGYLALGFSRPDNRADSEPHGSLITVVYLLVTAFATGITFLGTYFGLGYKLFWLWQVIQYAGLLLIWVTATKGVVPMAVEREANARVVSYRKEGILQGLLQVSSALQNAELVAFESLRKCINSLHDELKYFPNQATGIEAEKIVSDINGWVQQLMAMNPKWTETEQSQNQIDQMLIQGKGLQRRVAQWKRI